MSQNDYNKKVSQNPTSKSLHTYLYLFIFKAIRNLVIGEFIHLSHLPEFKGSKVTATTVSKMFRISEPRASQLLKEYRNTLSENINNSEIWRKNK
jgi:hypothetical protein